jgi:hypothetical protein
MQPVYVPQPQQVPQTVYPIANDYNIPAGAIGNIEKGTEGPPLQQTVYPPVHTINSTEPPQILQAKYPELDPLQQHIETLKRNDPKITEHLGKLANMSENDKGMFAQLLLILDNM